jgi:cellulose synthase/poly-beta-1,6-N-acetylglucosamine synthase-like glycosyltransferase
MVYHDELTVDIGLPLYNEERNIGRLLMNLLSQSLPPNFILNSIIVVSSSTDKTDEIVRDFGKLDSRVKLIREKERKGKSAGIKLLLREANSDIIIMSSGDIFPARDTISKMLLPFRDESIGYVAGRPIPIDGRETFWGFAGHFIWDLQSYFADRERGKLAGELNAFRNRIVNEIPDNIINDDLYLQFAIERRGYKSIYVSDALIFTQSPKGLKDYIRQRRRVRLGHLQIKKELDLDIATANPFKALKLIILESIWTLGILFIEGIAHISAHIDLKLGRIPSSGWQMVDTTKTISEADLLLLKAKYHELISIERHPEA